MISLQGSNSGMPSSIQIPAQSVSAQPPAADSRSLFDVRQRLEENFRRVEALLREMEAEADPKMQLAAARELRLHIAQAERTLDATARAEALEEFQSVVMAALEAASATVRRKVIDVLNARAGERAGS